MKKPVLYVEALPINKKQLAFDFCYSAMMGAVQADIKWKPFQSIYDIPGDPTSIIVGSVEMCAAWLKSTGHVIPELPNIFPFQEFLGRHITVAPIEKISYPSFIKPYKQIKAFTGFVATNKLYVDIFAEGYKGLVLAQDVVEIISEYRMYINCNRIIGLKHCRGDCLTFPDRFFIEKCFTRAKEVIDHHAYTLDFGVLEDGSTILIEINDGWATGNYGLEPHDYYMFVRNRWLQITGIRHRME